MRLPVRGLRCRHATVVDAARLVDYCLANDYWNCPLCEAECLFPDLRVDQQLRAVFANAPADGEFVVLTETATEYFTATGERCDDDEEVVVV